jgi:3-oxoadipate enol-lactonase
MGSLTRRFKVIRYDGRGHGRSGAPPGDYTLDQLGRDLLGVLDAADVEHVSVCGLSLGGLVAQWVSIHHPDRITRAVFANTAARIGSRDLWQARIQAVQSGGMAAIRDGVLERFLSDKFRRDHPDATADIGRMLEDTSPAGYIGCCAALRDGDLRGLVAAIRVPCLIIAGALDQATPPAQGRELHEAIAGSELELLPDAGHLSNLERPDVFSAIVVDFLTRSREEG